MADEPIENSYQVLPWNLLAGEYPGDLDANLTRHRLRWLLKAGVRSFLDLTQEGEADLIPYTDLLQQEAEHLGYRVVHQRMPIPDMGIPSRSEMTQILDAVNRALDDSGSVYLHCYGGIGRTGTVVGCFLVRHGMTGVQALQQIARWRRDIPNGWRVSPETQEQHKMVIDWKEERLDGNQGFLRLTPG